VSLLYCQCSTVMSQDTFKPPFSSAFTSESFFLAKRRWRQWRKDVVTTMLQSLPTYHLVWRAYVTLLPLRIIILLTDTLIRYVDSPRPLSLTSIHKSNSCQEGVLPFSKGPFYYYGHVDRALLDDAGKEREMSKSKMEDETHCFIIAP